MYGASFEEFEILIPFAALDAFVKALRHVPQVRLQVLQAPRRLAVGQILAIAPALGSAVAVLQAAGPTGPGIAAVLVSAIWAVAVWLSYVTRPHEVG